MSKKILIAKVNSIFGIKGEVKLIVYSDEPHNIEKYRLYNSKEEEIKITISNKNKTIVGNSSGNPIVIAKIAGVEDRTTAEKLRGQEFFANRDDFAKTKENEFYYSDLIGLQVIDENNNKIAIVNNVMDFGAGGIIEISFTKPQQGFEKIENFSFKNEIFPEVNLKAGFIKMIIPQIIEKK